MIAFNGLCLKSALVNHNSKNPYDFVTIGIHFPVDFF